MPLLEARDIHSGYGGVDILHGIDMFLDEGEIVTVVGPNGAGKSTLIKTLFGLIRPAKGSVWFRNQDITGSDPERLVRLGLTYVPQVENIFPSLTVRENLQMGAYLRKDDFRPRIREVLDMFPNLKRALDVKARNLSGGEKQMVALGKTLMLNPQVMLIDEPSAGLAPVLVDMIFRKILEVNQSGVSIMLVEQNARRALHMASRGYVLEMGQKRFEDTGKALLENPDVGKMYLGG